MALSNPFVIALLALGASMIASLVLVRRMRGTSAILREYSFVCVAIAWWTFGYAGDLAATSLSAKLAFHWFAWIGIAAAPLGALLLALRYTRRTLPAYGYVALAIVPTASVLLGFTNHLHHLLETEAVLVREGSLLLRRSEGAVFFWVYLAWAYACVLGTLVAYGSIWFAGSPIFRRQARALFFTSVVPVTTSVVVNFGIASFRGLDATPFSFAFTLLGFTWALSREGFLDLVPVAHDLVVASMDDPIVVVDSRDRVLDANPAALALSDATFVPGIDFAGLFAGAGELVRAAAATSVRDVHIRGRDYELRHAGLGFGAGRVLFLRDITDRKAAEREREDALEAVESALRVRAEFIARMSHELRTPLHGIVGSLELLLRTLDDDRRRFGEAASVSARALLELVNEVLDFERMDAGVLEVRPEDVELAALARTVVDSFRGTAESKGIALELDARELGGTTVRIDPRRIRQLLTNLVGNALKFTSDGSVVLVGHTRRVGPTSIEVELRVEDTGPGIPEASLARIFEPFVQLDEGTTRRADGAGLGLTIGRRIADAMGATLTIENRPGGGIVARFVGRFEESDVRISRVSSTEYVESIAGVRVLLAENHPVSRAVVTWMLEELGCVATTADDGIAAIAACTTEEFDLVLMDLHMPGLDGLEATRRIRARGLDLPIVAFTADSRADLRDDCVTAGLDDVLLKPIDLRGLHDLIARTVASSGERERIRAPRAGSVDARLLSLYRATYPDELLRLRRAVAVGDLAAARGVVHGLAGASAMLSFTSVVELCRELLDANSIDEATVDELESACDRSASPLRSEEITL